jgi:hypothetical protein
MGVGGGDHTSSVFVSLGLTLGLTLGLSLIFPRDRTHVVRTLLCHFDTRQLRALRFVAGRRTTTLGFWGRRE